MAWSKEFFKKQGQQGGLKTKAKMPADHYKKIGKKGGSRPKKKHA